MWGTFVLYERLLARPERFCGGVGDPKIRKPLKMIVDMSRRVANDLTMMLFIILDDLGKV